MISVFTFYLAADTDVVYGGEVVQVGPTRDLKKPSEAAAIAQNGDTIEIDAGVYACDTGVKWRADDLTIRGVGGRAHMKAEGCSIPGGKGIWNPLGDNLTIENIEFSGAVVPDKNGAGIRFDGGGKVVIRNSYFHNNQEGILFTPHSATIPLSETDLIIENSEFGFNGYSNGSAHNFYINKIRSFTLKDSYSHDSAIGHLVKTRAETNYILYNRLSDENGTGSYNIDISNGGLTYIIGNIIEQGPNSPNYGLISYAPESFKNTNKRLYVVNNTIINNHPSATSVFAKLYGPGYDATFINNLIVGLPESKFFVESKTDGTERITLSNNIFTDSSVFVNKTERDYRLTSGASAIDAGTTAISGGDFSLLPIRQYKNVADSETRVIKDRLDVGAYEFTGTKTAVVDSGVATIPKTTNLVVPISVPIKSVQQTSSGTGLVFTYSLGRSMSNSVVKQLQIFLNKDPQTAVAVIGAGAPGFETNYFGTLTQNAVERFQAKYGIVSSGSPATTGFGHVGPKTRAKLNEVSGR